MPISVLDIRNAMRAQLGTVGTQRYLDEQHYIPAIQGADRQFKAFINSLLAERKGSEELLSEVTMLKTFQTNQYGGVTLTSDQLGHDVWTITAVYPDPILLGQNQNPLPANVDQSLFRDDLIVISPGKKRCTRVTMEQVPDTVRSRFMPGSELLANSPMRTYAYYIINRTAGRWAPGSFELIILPVSVTGRKLVGIAYLKDVGPIASINDTLPYPVSAFQLIRDLALNELSVRQGAKPMYQVTVESVRALMQTQA